MNTCYRLSYLMTVRLALVLGIAALAIDAIDLQEKVDRGQLSLLAPRRPLREVPVRMVQRSFTSRQRLAQEFLRSEANVRGKRDDETLDLWATSGTVRNMADAPPWGLTRRQFLVGGATSAAAVWAAPKLGWWSRASGLAMDPVSPDAETFLGRLPFSDNFDQEFPGGLLTNWNVVRPVQLLGTTQFGVPSPANQQLDSTGFLAGHGIVVAMAGVLGRSTVPGRIQTVQSFAFGAGRYALSFRVAGSHHRAESWPASLVASLPGCRATRTVRRAASDDFGRFIFRFRVGQPAVSTIVFESGDAPGQAGVLLDDVSLVSLASEHDDLQGQDSLQGEMVEE